MNWRIAVLLAGLWVVWVLIVREAFWPPETEVDCEND